MRLSQTMWRRLRRALETSNSMDPSSHSAANSRSRSSSAASSAVFAGGSIRLGNPAAPPRPPGVLAPAPARRTGVRAGV
eukprot:5532141-Pyramimonas_sp.AAC.2